MDERMEPSIAGIPHSNRPKSNQTNTNVDNISNATMHPQSIQNDCKSFIELYHQFMKNEEYPEAMKYANKIIECGDTQGYMFVANTATLIFKQSKRAYLQTPSSQNRKSDPIYTNESTTSQRYFLQNAQKLLTGKKEEKYDVNAKKEAFENVKTLYDEIIAENIESYKTAKHKNKKIHERIKHCGKEITNLQETMMGENVIDELRVLQEDGKQTAQSIQLSTLRGTNRHDITQFNESDDSSLFVDKIRRYNPNMFKYLCDEEYDSDAMIVIVQNKLLNDKCFTFIQENGERYINITKLRKLYIERYDLNMKSEQYEDAINDAEQLIQNGLLNVGKEKKANAIIIAFGYNAEGFQTMGNDLSELMDAQHLKKVREAYHRNEAGIRCYQECNEMIQSEQTASRRAEFKMKICESIRAYSDAINLLPNQSIFYLNRCSALFIDGNYDDALEDIERFIANKPCDIEGYEKKIQILMQTQRLPECRNVYKISEDIVNYTDVSIKHPGQEQCKCMFGVYNAAKSYFREAKNVRSSFKETLNFAIPKKFVEDWMGVELCCLGFLVIWIWMEDRGLEYINYVIIVAMYTDFVLIYRLVFPGLMLYRCKFNQRLLIWLCIIMIHLFIILIIEQIIGLYDDLNDSLNDLRNFALITNSLALFYVEYNAYKTKKKKSMEIHCDNESTLQERTATKQRLKSCNWIFFTRDRLSLAGRPYFVYVQFVVPWLGVLYHGWISSESSDNDNSYSFKECKFKDIEEHVWCLGYICYFQNMLVITICVAFGFVCIMRYLDDEKEYRNKKQFAKEILIKQFPKQNDSLHWIEDIMNDDDEMMIIKQYRACAKKCQCNMTAVYWTGATILSILISFFVIMRQEVHRINIDYDAFYEDNLEYPNVILFCRISSFVTFVGLWLSFRTLYRIVFRVNQVHRVMKMLSKRINVETITDIVRWWELRNFILKWELPLVYEYLDYGVGCLFLATIISTIWLLIQIFFVDGPEEGDSTVITHFFDSIFERYVDLTLFASTLIVMVASWIIFVTLLKPYIEQNNHIKMLRKELLQLQMKQECMNFENGLTNQDLQKASEIRMMNEKDLIVNDDHDINGVKIKKSRQIIAMINALEYVITFCKDHPASATVLGSKLNGSSLKLFQGYLLTIFIVFAGRLLASNL